MKNSKIEWTDHTFNPWKWGSQGQRVRTSAANWRKPLKWNREAEAAGKRARVFCASLADVFEDKPDQPEMDEWRGDLFDLINRTPHLDWLLLTKRPENVRKAWHWELMDYPPNVWIGTSVENQEQADKRIPALLTIPAAVRFLSMEPLLGPVDLTPWLNYVVEQDDWGLTIDGFDPDFDWVIVGGDDRPMHPDWARGIRDQCQAAGVPFFFKQWGKWLPGGQGGGMKFQATPGEAMRPWIATGDSTQFYKLGKHAAGRLLDGREWNEFPVISKTETTGD